MRNPAFLLVLCLLAGCGRQALLQRFSSPAEQQAAKGYIDQLRAHDFDAIEGAMDPGLKGPALRGTLTRMADLIPAQEPQSILLVGAPAHARRT